MKGTVKNFFDVWKADYSFKTYASSLLSSLIGLAFTIYNGFLGIYYSSIWNGSICVCGKCCVGICKIIGGIENESSLVSRDS